jgi:DinB superfamily
MTTKDTIRNTLDMSQMIIGSYIGDLSDADILIRPVPGMNHIAWQLGHLISSERYSTELLRPGSAPPLPAGFDDAHKTENAGSNDASQFYSVAKYQELWKAQREAFLALLNSTDESDFDRTDEKFPSYMPSVGAILNMAGVHALMHCGQFVAVRRLLNKPVTI